MAGGRAEHRPGQEVTFQPPLQNTLRDYWNNPNATPSSLQRLPRRTRLQVTTPSLWEQGETGVLRPKQETLSYQTAKPPEHILTQEYIQRRGVATLSTRELLTTVLQIGEEGTDLTPRLETLLTQYNLRQLINADVGEMVHHFGLGEMKATQLQALFEVARRLTVPTSEEHPQIESPRDAAALVRAEMEFLDHEEIRVLTLDTKNRVIANQMLYKGTVNSSVLRTAEIFRTAIARKSPNVLVCHNHPSGDPSPSAEDIAVTEQWIEASKVLDIELVDHLIIGKNPLFVSLKEKLRW